jgi:uncharacterized protein (DUF58 family)
MPDSKRFLHPEAIQRISRLELRARHIVEGFLSGLHRSPYFGQSIEFRQHREYVPGDDLRHVDWKVWARQDRMYVKQYEEDTNMQCQLLVDASASMHYGSGPLNKYDYACTIAACLGYLSLKQQDGVSCTIFDEDIRARIPARTRRTHLTSIVNLLDISEPKEKTELYTVLRKAADLDSRRGMMVIVSDLLVERDGMLRGLRLLRQRGHDVLVFHVMDDDELDFSFNGPTRFDGLESLDHLNCNPRALRDGYLEALNHYLEEVRHGCARNKIDYTLVRTSDPLDAVLSAFLHKRIGRQAKA